MQNEVKQTRVDLESANNEIIELKKQLDVANKLYQDKNFSFIMMMKKAKSNEEELFAKRDLIPKLQMQYKMIVSF